MKKLIGFVSLMVLLAACTAEPPANNSGMANANKAAETKTAAAPSEADIMAKEKGAWDAFKKKDAAAFEKMLTTDYIEVLDSGVKDRATSIAGMKDFELSDLTFADWKMLPIDKDAVIITYSVNVKGTFKGEAVPPGPYREASVYVNRNGEWLAAYFQETLAATAPSTMAPPPPTPAPKTSASPAASMKPAETTSDVIANEKLVWDLFKAKNFDAFAGLLAPEFVETEADGVYDKAGSVKGVQMMNAGQFELSDWKAMKFDDDASLVTYTVTSKGAKPMKDYHSSIWANRNGKWVALYHQGTPAQAATGAKPEAKKM
jgi:hypothetical protein